MGSELRRLPDHRPLTCGILVALSCCFSTAILLAEEPEEGAVVEEVAPGSAAARAGLQPGDAILSWSRGDGLSGPVRSPFELPPVEIEQAPRGAVVLRGAREGASAEWTLPPGSWGIKARPTFPEPLLAVYRQGRDRIAAGDLAEGIGDWRSAVEAADRRQDSLRAAWLQSRLARELAGAARWAEADEAWERAVARLEPPGPAAAQLLRQWGESFQRRNLWDRAEECYRRALALDAAESLAAAWDLNALSRPRSARPRRGPPSPAGEPGAAQPEVRAAVARGLSLTPLPSARAEILEIAGLYPGARTFLGAEATEERAKSMGKDARYLHFACHGLLDERFPLNSALALSIPERPAEGQENGLLQAWEVIESVRLDADLVTLSACDTALGKEMGGEGLVGLTRAFQFAGARTVLASLWSISDDSTAGFMKRFYGYLRSGKPKDEALRAAQIDQIRDRSGSSHPFHWAAFELFGDWR